MKKKNKEDLNERLMKLGLLDAELLKDEFEILKTNIELPSSKQLKLVPIKTGKEYFEWCNELKLKTAAFASGDIKYLIEEKDYPFKILYPEKGLITFFNNAEKDILYMSEKGLNDNKLKPETIELIENWIENNQNYKKHTKCYYPPLKYSFEEAEKLAEKNDGYALFELFIYYCFGIDRKIDLNKSLEYIKKSAKSNCGAGVNALGILYNKGWGVLKDEAKAVEHFKKANELGYMNGTYNYAGILIRSGDSSDQYEAFKCYLKCVDEDTDEIFFNIGKCYILGIEGFLKKDRKKGLEYLNKGAEKEEPKTLAFLVSAYGKGICGFEKNIKLSKEYYLKIKNPSNYMMKMMKRVYQENNNYKGEIIMNIKMFKTSKLIYHYNEIAYLLIENNRLFKYAEKFIHIALKDEPNNSDYLDTLGFLQMKKGELDLAKISFEKSIKENPENKVAIEHLEEVNELISGNAEPQLG